MASTQQHCDICDHRHITNPSTVWCPECEQGLCDDCNDYHGFSKSSQNHVTVSIRDYLSMSSSIPQTSNMCMEHNEQYQMVCQAHDTIICPKCIENHDGCKGIIPLSKVTENVKKSILFHETLQSLKDNNANIKTLQNELKKQQGSIKQQEETTLSQISDARKKINDQFDKLEKKIRDDISEITAKIKNDINHTLQILEKKTDITNKAEQQLQDMDRYATDLQTYFGLRKISSELGSIESYTQSLIGDHSVDEVTLLLNIDDKIDNITKNTGSFGLVKVQTGPCALALVTHKNKQAQSNLKGMGIKLITEVKFRLAKKVQTDLKSIRGIVVLPCGNYVLSDYHSTAESVCIFSTDWKRLSYISVKPAYASDVTFIDDKTVVVASNNRQKKGVNFIDIDTKTINYIPTDYECCGLISYNGSLFICASSKGLFKLNPQDGSSTAIVQFNLSTGLESYIEMFGNNLYYTKAKTVSCCDINGKAIWTFEDENILRRPRGIAVDNSGNVYVTCSMLHRVVVLSPDGLQNRQVLSHDDGLKSPIAIHFDRKNNRLLVANENFTVMVYEVI
ncbi:uncharacterized protein LOC134684375 [Mytilus trossulus]|uniref:uncharacterized protein LOC134684375 n=1 Tax=Mytilus trossulus TaxID=6551 RepID=UPI003006F3A8